jgi:hypothetical protein
MQPRLILLILISATLFACGRSDKNYERFAGDPMWKEFDRDSMIADFVAFKKIIAEKHPAIDEHLSRDEWYALCDSIDDTFYKNKRTSIALREFYSKLSFLVNELKCFHSNLYVPDQVDEDIDSLKLFFPVTVRLNKDSLVTLFGNGLPSKSRILSIDGHDISKVLDSLMIYPRVDGEHRETQRYRVASMFGYYYYLHFGGRPEFKVTYLHENTTKTATLSAIGLKALDIKQKIKYYYNLDDLPLIRLSYEKDSIAYYFLPSFKRNINDEALASIISSDIADLKNHTEIKNLIIDLRGNRGGSLSCGFALFRALAGQPFNKYHQLRTRFAFAPYPELLPDGGQFVSDEQAEMERLLANGPVGNFLITDSIADILDPIDNRFEGNLYVLVDAESASMASYFAQMVKNTKRGIVVGVETSGGSDAFNMGSYLHYTLPKTGIEISFCYTTLLPSQNSKLSRRGVIPDYIIPYQTDIRTGSDDLAYLFIRDSLILKKK